MCVSVCMPVCVCLCVPVCVCLCLCVRVCVNRACDRVCVWGFVCKLVSVKTRGGLSMSENVDLGVEER